MRIPRTLALLLCVTAMRLPAQTATFSVLHQFTGHGSYGVNGPPVQGPDGAVYGTTYTGGDTNAYVTVFKVDGNCNLTILDSFTQAQRFSSLNNGFNSDGAYKTAPLAFAAPQTPSQTRMSD